MGSRNAPSSVPWKPSNPTPFTLLFRPPSTEDTALSGTPEKARFHGVSILESSNVDTREMGPWDGVWPGRAW